MKICWLEIEIFLSSMIMVIVMMFVCIMSGMIMPTMCMIPIMSEYESTDDIDKKSYNSHDKCYVIVDCKWWYEPFHWKDSDKKSHDTKQNSACIRSEDFYFPSSECKLGIFCMFSSKYIGKQRYPECKSVSSHMPTISKERHRVRYPSDDDLYDHRECCDDEDDECAFFCSCFRWIEVVGVSGMRMSSIFHKVDLNIMYIKR